MSRIDSHTWEALKPMGLLTMISLIQHTKKEKGRKKRPQLCHCGRCFHIVSLFTAFFTVFSLNVFKSSLISGVTMDFTGRTLQSSQASSLQKLLCWISRCLANIYCQPPLHSMTWSYRQQASWNNEKVSDLPKAIVGARGTFTSIF